MPPKFKNLTIFCIITILLYGLFYIRSPPWTVSVKESSVGDANVLNLPNKKIAEIENSIFTILKKYSTTVDTLQVNKVTQPPRLAELEPQPPEPGPEPTTENGILNQQLPNFKLAQKAMIQLIRKEVEQQVKTILRNAMGLNGNNSNKSNSFQFGNANRENDSHSDSFQSLDTNNSNPHNNSAKSDVENQSDISVIFNTNQSPEFNLEQNDTRLLQYINDHHLWPPLPLPYNLDKPFEDPTWREGQNKIVLKLLDNKRNGIFIEAGANDGEFLSNTLALERDFGWTGILVEPDRKAFKGLRGKNRKAWLSDVCLSVSSRPEKVKFLQFKWTSTWSKIANVSDHSKNWDKDEMEEVEVECMPFYSLVLALNMTTIDYFSLDIEGAELQILKTIPFDKVLIRTLSIEYDHIRLVPGADEELKNLMKSNGFTLVTRVAQGYAKDYIYAHNSILQNQENQSETTQAPLMPAAPAAPAAAVPELQIQPKMEVYSNFGNYTFPTIQVHRIN